MAIERIGDLEVGQDLDFQQRAWKVERVSWGVMLLVLIAALAGLFGMGPLSQASARSADGMLSVSYPRFARHAQPVSMTVSLSTETSTGDRARIWIEREYLDTIQIQAMVPEPENVEAGDDRVIFEIVVGDVGQPVEFTLSVEHQQSWLKRAEIGVDGGESVRIWQLVYP